jgi:putative ABC transport system permease protein
VLVRTIRGQSQRLIFEVNNQPLAQAVNPAWEMRQFFDTFMKGSRLLLLAISALVTVVAAVGILVSIYNSVSARLKEIAILRALGATRLRVLALICTEAAVVGFIGAVAGLVAGHALGGMGNILFRRYVGESINYMNVGAEEIAYVVLVVVIAALAGLVPALKAYKTPVATNLT